MIEAVLYKDQTREGRERLDILLHGAPSEEQWMADPAAIAEQERLMAMTGGADAMGGQAP